MSVRKEGSKAVAASIPGPAGLLPRRRRWRKSTGQGEEEEEERGASQVLWATKFLETPQWKQMLRDHGQDENDPDAIINRLV